MRALLCLLLLLGGLLPSSLSAQTDVLTELGLAAPQPRYLKAEQAFRLQTRQQGDRLQVDILIAEGYYLYQDKLHWQAEGARLGEVRLPPATPHEDAFFGQTRVYYQGLSLQIPLLDIQPGASLSLGYQGCTEGLCYPPMIERIALTPAAAALGAPLPTRPAAPDDSSLNQALQGGLLPTLGLFLLLGLGLALTPCMFPLYPILSSLILGQGALPLRRAFWLSLVFVQGMALTYTLLGLLVASVGLGLQAALQQPAVLIGFGLLYVALALSMFGLYELRLPAALQSRLIALSNRQRSGSTLGVGLMGLLSGLICSPCTTAPLSGALLFVAQSGDRLLGAAALYALSLGMGVPLLLLGSLGGRWLPRAGAWMSRVKVVFGFVLLAVPIWLLERLLPETWIRLAWVMLALALAGYLLRACLPRHPLRLGVQGLGLPALGALLWLALSPAEPEPLPFTAVTSLPELRQQLADARQAGRPVMLDLYADWCVACKQYERDTFSQARVRADLAPFVLLRADVTANTPANRSLLTQLQVLGLPAILFFDPQGQPLPASRLDGFVPPEAFIAHLNGMPDAEPGCHARQC